MFEAVIGRSPAVRVLAEPPGDPFLHVFGLEVRRHVPGLVHRIHEGDARLDLHFVALGGATHRKSERQSAQVVRGRQLTASCAFGFLRQVIRRLERLRVVDAHGNDTVVGQPTVADGLLIALAAQLNPEGGLIIHRAYYPVRVAGVGGRLAVVDTRRSRLVDAVSGGEPGAVMADGEVAKTLFLFVCGGGPGVLALKSCRSMSFIGNHYTRPDTDAQQGFRYPGAALVSANENLDPVADSALAHPVGYFAGIGGHLALHFGSADIAVIDCRIKCGVAVSFFPGVVARRSVRADCQHVYRSGGVLQVFAPYLGNERDGRTQHDGQFARRRQFFYDPERYASLSRSAGQNDSTPGLAHR